MGSIYEESGLRHFRWEASTRAGDLSPGFHVAEAKQAKKLLGKSSSVSLPARSVVTSAAT